jgi:hypothetical protein
MLLRAFYGLLRLGIVSGVTAIANATLRDYSTDIGRFFLLFFRGTFGGVINFFNGLFGGLFGRTVRVRQAQQQAQAA